MSARALLAALLLGAGPAAALAAPAEAAPPAPAAPMVERVVLRLPPGEDAAAVEGLVALQPGKPLSARALRRTATLLYQLGRFEDVVIRAEPAGPGAVTLVVECLPRRLVRSLAVREATPRPALDEGEVRRLVGIAVGDEYWPARLEAGVERVRAALLRRGHRAARIEGAAAGETAVDVTVAVDEGPPTRVRSLTLAGASAGVGPGVLAGLRLAPGAVLDLDALDADVRQLRSRLRRDGWLRARVGEPVLRLDGATAAVELPVEAGPRFELRFAGASAFDAADLGPQLGLDPDQPLDDAALEAAAGRLRTFYQERGWAAVRVEPRVERVPGGAEAAVVFRIDEGRRYRVDQVRFAGAKARGPAWLEERLRQGLEPLPPPEPGRREDDERLARASGSTAPPRSLGGVAPGEAWVEPVFKAAAARIVEAYRDEGFLEAAHEGTRVVLDARAGTATVELRLREGPRTLVSAVTFEGQEVVPAAELAAAARISAGDPLSFGAVEQARAAVLALYARRGHAYARVVDAEDFTPDRTAAALRFRVEEGPQVRIGAVRITGNARTRDDVIRSSVEVRPGDVYDPAAVARSQTSLLRLGVFRSAGLRLDEPEVPESEKDLTVELAERPWLSIAPGFGFSIANGPRVFVEYTQPNLLGRALEFSARAKVNYPVNVLDQRPDVVGKAPADRVEGYVNVGLHDPRVRVLGVPIALHLDGIGERVHRKAYDLTRASAVLGADLAALGRFALSLQGELEVADIRRSDAVQAAALTRADLERLRFPEGITTLISIRPVVSVDYRDNSVHPRSGWFAALGADYAHSLGYAAPGEKKNYLLFGALPGSEVFTNMLKLHAGASGYLPLGESVVLAVAARGGRVFPLDLASQTIAPKRFYLGGASTMRGYAEDELVPQDLRPIYLGQIAVCNNSFSGAGCTDAARSVIGGQPPPSVGGETFLLGKVEARVHVRGSLEVGLFADVGNLWLDPRNLAPLDLRVNVGFGLRFITPIGPAVVDLGFDTMADRRLAERIYAPHFSIGFF